MYQRYGCKLFGMDASKSMLKLLELGFRRRRGSVAAMQPTWNMRGNRSIL